MMKQLKRFSMCMLLGGAAAAAQGQVRAYFNPIVTRVSNSQVDNGDFSYMGVGSTSALRGGVSIGAMYMFAPTAHVTFGVDVRDEWQRGSNSLLNDFLIGVHAEGHVGERLKPYVQVSGGAGTTRSPYTAIHISRGLVKVYGGVDYTLNKRLDFRVVEIGYGPLTVSNSSIYNSTAAYPSSTLISFSSGLVVHFGK